MPKTLKQIFDERRRLSLGVINTMRNATDQMPRIEGITKADVLETLTTMEEGLQGVADGKLDDDLTLPAGTGR